MRFYAIVLVFLVSVTFTNAAETYYYLLPFDVAAEPSGNMFDPFQRAELDIEGDAFVFAGNSYEMERYLDDRASSISDARKKLFPEIGSGRFLVVRTGQKTDFTATLGETKRAVTVKEVASGDSATIADNYCILCLCMYYGQLAAVDGPGWPIFQELQYHFDDILWERFKRAGLKDAKRRDGFRAAFDGRERTGSIDLTRQFDLFSGVSAIRQNLNLWSTPNFKGDNARTIDVDSIHGITVAEIDWKPLLADVRNPVLDPLANYIPEDQHFVVFPNAKAAMQVLEAVKKSGLAALATPIPMLNSTMPGADTMLVERYCNRLGLTPEMTQKLVASSNIKSVALTGSDVHFKDGTDVAVLFETDDPEAVLRLLGDRPAEKIDSKTILLTESAYQLKRIKGTAKSGKSLASLDEFRYFRNRYKVGDLEETVFVYLSDATIRRWCSPRWRIGQARRLRQQARLAEITADRLGELVSMNFDRSETITPFGKDMIIDPKLQAEYLYSLTENGAGNEIYGTFVSLTPIAELPLDKVSVAEKEGYDIQKVIPRRNAE